ncbi:MAG: LysR family transcriptional regulator [Mailhella sp.]|nr:LysR family transcriptional regulator [Mailhella sp.]
MDIKKLETFVKATELGSLTRAAESLKCTQSAVSHIIMSLEKEFGFQLMARHRSGVALTAEGERMLPAIRSLLECSERLEREAADIRGLESGTVRIGTFSSVAVHWLPGMIKEFQEQHRNIEIKLLNGDYADVEKWLSEGAVDLGFVALPLSLACECIPLMEDRLLAVLPPDHRLAGEKEVPLLDLKDEPFIGLLAASDQDARMAMESVGVRPNVKFETKDDYAIIAMVANGLGISIMPELLLRGRTEGVVVRPVFPGVRRIIALAIPASGAASPSVRIFAEKAKEWVRRHSDACSDFSEVSY